MRRRGVLAVVAGIMGLAAIAPLGLRRVAFFRVRRVEVVGAIYLSGAQVATALRLPRGASLFDPLTGLARRVEAIPGVRSAVVRRRWPGTVVVQVEEAEPVALVPRSGVLVLVDARGAVLPFDPTRGPADLPVADPGPVVARVLARVREVEPELFAAVNAGRRAGGDVALEAWGGRLLLRPEAPDDAIHALRAVARDLTRRGHTFEELDGRFTDRVFVRGMRS